MAKKVKVLEHEDGTFGYRIELTGEESTKTFPTFKEAGSAGHVVWKEQFGETCQ